MKQLGTSYIQAGELQGPDYIVANGYVARWVGAHEDTVLFEFEDGDEESFARDSVEGVLQVSRSHFVELLVTIKHV